MKTAKLGAIFLVSLIALAGIGAGYAAWTDTLYIHGEVNTGSVGWQITEYSGTWVYKVPLGIPGADPPIDDEIAVRHYTYPAGWTGPLMVNGWIPIAHAYAYKGADDHHAIVEFDNIFPCINFEADLVITYTGTVPGKINAVILDGANWPTGEGTLDWYTELTIEVNPVIGSPYVVPQEQLPGIQLHEGDIIYVIMKIHLPQDNNLMSLSGSFDLTLEVVQWNEYPYPPET